MTASRRGPAASRARLVADLADTIDVLVDQPLVGVALFGDALPAIGRYTIERRLGAGATAVVYAARDTTLDRPVALKIVAGRDADGAWCARAHGEARALAKLSHPNVVAVHDVGEWRGHPFIAMELVDGVTLARWQADARRTWPEILRCYLAAGRGLEAAHSVGLVHRDFKPANVLVADSGRVVVTDFGLATRVEPAAMRVAAGSRPGVGTPAYLAPEQRIGAPSQPSADVYSFAVALCEALVGRHLALAPALDWRLELRRAGLPGRVCAAIARGMAAEPDRRWPHLGPLLAALEAALPASSRRRRTAGLVIGLAVAAAAAVAFAGVVRRPALLAGSIGAGPIAGEAPRSGVYVATARGLVEPNPTASAALLGEVPADQRGEAWSAVARATLLRPLARELRCLEAPPRSPPSLAHGLLAAADTRGRAIVCELAGERVTVLADGAVCARVLDGDHVGVFTAAGELAIFARGAGWQVRRRIAVGAPVGASRCDHDLTIVGRHAVVLRHGGAAAWQLIDLANLASTDLVEVSDARRRLLALSADRRLVVVWSDRKVWVAPIGGTADARAEVVAAALLAGHDPAGGVAVAVLGDAGTIIDVQRGVVLRRDPVQAGSRMTALEVAPGGRMAIGGTARGGLLWWPLSAGSRAPWLETVSEVAIAQIALNAAGTRLVWRDGHGGIGVRDVGRSSGYELPLGERSICQVSFATDDRVVAASCDGRVLAWDLPEERAFIAGRHDLAHCQPGCESSSKGIWSAGIDASGSVVATAGRDDTVGIWPLDRGALASGARRLWLGPDRPAFTAQFLGDRLLVGAHGAAAEIWDWRAGKRIGELPGHEAWVYELAVVRPARGPATIVTGAKSGTLRFWSEHGRHIRDTKVTTWGDNRVNHLAVSPNGRLVAASFEQGNVAVCDAATGELIATVRAHVGWARRVVFLDDESLLSAGDDGVVQRISVPSGAITASIPAHDKAIYDLDRLGDSLLTASVDGTIRLWDLRTGSRVRTYVGHGQFVGTVRWHPSGERFVSGGEDGRVCVWHRDRDTCHDWLIGHRAEVRTAQFIDATRVVTASFDGSVRVWTPVPPATIERLSAELARRAPACLDERQRQSYLGEPAPDATARARACRAAAR